MREKLLERFYEYVDTFDLENPNITRKKYHTKRVVDYAMQIAENLNMTEEEKDIVYLCALLHDIGRFTQMRDYGTYVDLASVDHGDQGVKVLTTDSFIDEFTTDSHIKDIIIFSTGEHNKIDITGGTEEERKYTRIVRDADKLDIIIEQCNTIDEKTNLTEGLFDELYQKKSCSNKYVNTPADKVLRQLGFMFDVNFKYTFEILLNKKTIEGKIKLLYENTGDEKLRDLEKFILDYMKNFEGE